VKAVPRIKRTKERTSIMPSGAGGECSADRAFTLSESASGEGRYVTLERYGHVRLIVEPLPATASVEMEWEVPETEIPSVYRPAILAAIAESAGAEEGPPTAFARIVREADIRDFGGVRRMVRIRVLVVGGSFHDVNSGEFAYQVAAHLAFREALERGGVVPASLSSRRRAPGSRRRPDEQSG
jgi:elongation factor G